jgi:hypothetical protein
MSSFDPDNFGAPTTKGGGRSYDGYDSGSSKNSGESRFRTVPLVLSVIFGIAAIVCAVISFGLNGTNLTASEESLRSTVLLVGIASFIGLIVTARKAVRKR